MNKLGVVIITKNEEKNIARCLNSVAWAHEIIVVDSGSTDKTVEIAKSLGAKVIERHWPGDGPQKHFGVRQLSLETSWCLVLDADEELTAQLQMTIQKTLQDPSKGYYYKIRRKSFFLGKMIHHGDWGKDWIIRLFNINEYIWSEDIVHSKLAHAEKKCAPELNGILLHHSQDSIHTALVKLNDYSDGTSKILYEKNHSTSLLKASLHKNWTFFRSFVLKRGFLDGSRGYLIAKLSSYGSYFKYVKLWEKQHNDKK